MRAAGLLLIGLVIAAFITGCEPQLGTSFRTTMAARESGIHIDALPVTLHELTNLVTGIDVSDTPSETRGSATVDVVAGEPNAVRVHWLGGACEGRVMMIFGGLDDGYGLFLDAFPTPGGMLGCPALGVHRTLVIRFTTPMAENRIALRVIPG